LTPIGSYGRLQKWGASTPQRKQNTFDRMITEDMRGAIAKKSKKQQALKTPLLSAN